MKYLTGISCLLLVAASSVLADDYPKDDQCNNVYLDDQHYNKAGYMVLNNKTSHNIIARSQKLERGDGCPDNLDIGSVIKPGESKKWEMIKNAHDNSGCSYTFAIQNYDDMGNDFPFKVKLTRKQTRGTGHLNYNADSKNDTFQHFQSLEDALKEYGYYINSGWNFKELGNCCDHQPTKTAHDNKYYVTVARIPSGCQAMKDQSLYDPKGRLARSSQSDWYHRQYSSCKQVINNFYCSHTQK